MVEFCFAPVKVQFTFMSVQKQVTESSTGETVKKNKNTHTKLNTGSTKELVVDYSSLNMDVAATKLQTLKHGCLTPKIYAVSPVSEEEPEIRLDSVPELW